MPEIVSIIGDGQMGLVLADALACAGAEVRLWGPTPEKVADLAATRTSPQRLAGFRLADRVVVAVEAEAALADARLIVNAIPTQFVRPVWKKLRPHVPSGAAIVSVSKGIENETLLRPTQVVLDAIDEPTTDASRPVCCLSGPSIAAELARRLPATMVAASTDDATARLTQRLFTVEWLRVYRHDDVIGVEVAGATKNIIALAAGIVDGLGVGDNAKSALLARGLAEIARLGAAVGARTDTFFGVAGVGDLATTCFSPEGRNRTCGERLGRGETLQTILDTTASVIEGIATTRSVVQLAADRGVDMPITAAVHRILFEGMAPTDAIRALMSRAPKAEVIG